YSYPVCTTCGRRHPGECRRAAGTCFKSGQAGHLQKDFKKNTTTNVFPDEIPGIPPVHEVEFNIELIPGSEPISQGSLPHGSDRIKGVKGPVTGIVRARLY
nr:uncharacterized protein [Tanacetum cinerariifolium]